MGEDIDLSLTGASGSHTTDAGDNPGAVACGSTSLTLFGTLGYAFSMLSSPVSGPYRWFQRSQAASAMCLDFGVLGESQGGLRPSSISVGGAASR
jgi:hypothetical protein